MKSFLRILFFSVGFATVFSESENPYRNFRSIGTNNFAGQSTGLFSSSGARPNYNADIEVIHSPGIYMQYDDSTQRYYNNQAQGSSSTSSANYKPQFVQSPSFHEKYDARSFSGSQSQSKNTRAPAFQVRPQFFTSAGVQEFQPMSQAVLSKTNTGFSYKSEIVKSPSIYEHHDDAPKLQTRTSVVPQAPARPVPARATYVEPVPVTRAVFAPVLQQVFTPVVQPAFAPRHSSVGNVEVIRSVAVFEHHDDSQIKNYFAAQAQAKSGARSNSASSPASGFIHSTAFGEYHDDSELRNYYAGLSAAKARAAASFSAQTQRQAKTKLAPSQYNAEYFRSPKTHQADSHNEASSYFSTGFQQQNQPSKVQTKSKSASFEFIPSYSLGEFHDDSAIRNYLKNQVQSKPKTTILTPVKHEAKIYRPVITSPPASNIQTRVAPQSQAVISSHPAPSVQTRVAPQSQEHFEVIRSQSFGEIHEDPEAIVVSQARPLAPAPVDVTQQRVAAPEVSQEVHYTAPSTNEKAKTSSIGKPQGQVEVIRPENAFIKALPAPVFKSVIQEPAPFSLAVAKVAPIVPRPVPSVQVTKQQISAANVQTNISPVEVIRSQSIGEYHDDSAAKANAQSKSKQFVQRPVPALSPVPVVAKQQKIVNIPFIPTNLQIKSSSVPSRPSFRGPKTNVQTKTSNVEVIRSQSFGEIRVDSKGTKPLTQQSSAPVVTTQKKIASPPLKQETYRPRAPAVHYVINTPVRKAQTKSATSEQPQSKVEVIRSQELQSNVKTYSEPSSKRSGGFTAQKVQQVAPVSKPASQSYVAFRTPNSKPGVLRSASFDESYFDTSRNNAQTGTQNGSQKAKIPITNNFRQKSNTISQPQRAVPKPDIVRSQAPGVNSFGSSANRPKTVNFGVNVDAKESTHDYITKLHSIKSSQPLKFVQAGKPVVPQESFIKSAQPVKIVRPVQNFRPVQPANRIEPVQIIQSVKPAPSFRPQVQPQVPKTAQSVQQFQTNNRVEPAPIFRQSVQPPLFKTVQPVQQVKTFNRVEPAPIFRPSVEPPVFKTIQPVQQVQTFNRVEPAPIFRPSVEPPVLKAIQPVQQVQTFNRVEPAQIFKSVKPVQLVQPVQQPQPFKTNQRVQIIQNPEASQLPFEGAIMIPAGPESFIQTKIRGDASPQDIAKALAELNIKDSELVKSIRNSIATGVAPESIIRKADTKPLSEMKKQSQISSFITQIQDPSFIEAIQRMLQLQGEGGKTPEIRIIPRAEFNRLVASNQLSVQRL